MLNYASQLFRSNRNNTKESQESILVHSEHLLLPKPFPVILCTVSGLLLFSLTNPLQKAYYLILHLLFLPFCSSADLSGKRSPYIQALGEFPQQEYNRNTGLLCDLLSWCVSEVYSKDAPLYKQSCVSLQLVSNLRCS